MVGYLDWQIVFFYIWDLFIVIFIQLYRCSALWNEQPSNHKPNLNHEVFRVLFHNWNNFRWPSFPPTVHALPQTKTSDICFLYPSTFQVAINRVVLDIWPFLYPVSGGISGFIWRISGQKNSLNPKTVLTNTNI